MQRVTIHGLSAMFLAAMILFATTAGSAAGSSGSTGQAAKRPARHRAKLPVPSGVVFGGVTSAHAPVVIEVSRDGRQVVQATMAVPVQCQMTGQAENIPVLLPAHYTHVPISTTGAFHGEEEETQSEAGQTTTLTGRLSGAFNRAGTSVTGTWSLKLVVHDATGAVVSQCDSGAVSFTAIQ